MENKNKIAIISTIIALIALLVIISSISFMGLSQGKKASIENVLNPLNTFDRDNSQAGTTIIHINDGDSDDDDDDDDDDEDEDAPDSITGLTAIEVTQNNIHWTWTNPSDSDFYRVLIYINSAYRATISGNEYNATGLIPDTDYTITIHTMDDDGNVNDTDVSNTQTTLQGGSDPNSPVIFPLFPSIYMLEDGTEYFPHNLDFYVTDPDNLDTELTWTFTGNVNVNVNIDSSRNVTFTPNSGWSGTEYITFRVTDPDGNFDTDTILVDVAPMDDPAQWNTLADQTINEDSSAGTVVYQNIVGEASDSDSPLTVTVVSNYAEFDLTIVGNDLVIDNLKPNWYGSRTITLDCNGIQAQFQLNINQLFDDCVEVCGFYTCDWICD